MVPDIAQTVLPPILSSTSMFDALGQVPVSTEPPTTTCWSAAVGAET